MLELLPEEIYEKMASGGNLSVVVGRRGGGKTSFGFKILEKAHEAGKRTFIVGFPEEAKKFVPNFIEIAGNLKEVPNGAFALLDEAVIQYNARSWQKAKNLSLTEIADLARHKELSVVFIAINTAMLDPNVLRTIDTLALKEPSLLQEHMERPFLKKFLTKTVTAMKDIPVSERLKYSFIFDDRMEGLVKTDLPSFWTDELSKSWKDYSAAETKKTEGIRVIGALSMPMGQAPICFDCENFVHTEYEAWCTRGLDVGQTECDFYSQKNVPKIWTWKKKDQKPPWAMGNPPTGCQQCLSCENFEGETNKGMLCKHFQKPVKFIEGDCKYKKMQILNNPAGLIDAQKLSAYKRKVEKAVEEYKKVKRPFISPDGQTQNYWNSWKKFAKEEGFSIFSEESGGTDKYSTDGSPPGQVWKVEIHQGWKNWSENQPFHKSYPMSCNCPGWANRRICKHSENLADTILTFFEASAISTESTDFGALFEATKYRLKERQGSRIHLISESGATESVGDNTFFSDSYEDYFFAVPKNEWFPIVQSLSQSSVKMLPIDKTGNVYLKNVWIEKFVGSSNEGGLARITNSEDFCIFQPQIRPISIIGLSSGFNCKLPIPWQGKIFGGIGRIMPEKYEPGENFEILFPYSYSEQMDASPIGFVKIEFAGKIVFVAKMWLIIFRGNQLNQSCFTFWLPSKNVGYVFEFKKLDQKFPPEEDEKPEKFRVVDLEGLLKIFEQYGYGHLELTK